jgi:hypothetical protein
MRQKKREYVSEWKSNPAALVDRINSGTPCRLANRGDDPSRRKPIRGAKLKYNKYVIVDLSDGECPIFEGTDRIEFLLTSDRDVV